jgi:hypothetical protein
MPSGIRWSLADLNKVAGSAEKADALNTMDGFSYIAQQAKRAIQGAAIEAGAYFRALLYPPDVVSALVVALYSARWPRRCSQLAS